jgi:hypothetical protein
VYKTRLYELNARQWKTAVDNTVANPVLYLYRLYTTNYVMSPYLNLKSYQLRKAICKFRLSSHNLRIETGRHSKPKTPRENRICKLCTVGEVQDEIHVLLSCPALTPAKLHLFDHLNATIPFFDSYNNMGKFLAIMHSDNPRTLKLLGKFIVHVFRQNY